MNDLRKDLEKVNSIGQLPIDEVCKALEIDTDAGKTFVRFCLANAMLMNRKQKDYGPRNISQGGTYGCLIRMSDKISRIFNLYNKQGCKRRAINESIEDSFRDIANYSIIALMVENNQWPMQ